MNMSDSEDYGGDSDAEEDLSIRNYEVTKSPSKNDLLPLLECPVCMELPLPPIRTCCQGHIICAACTPRLRVCPLCQQHIGTGRNFFAEDFLNKSIFRCKYYEDGCFVELPGVKINEHVKDCRFRPLKCRYCNKKVAFNDIDHHLLKAHRIGRWDLNDEGARILMCHTLRTRNPNAVLIDNGESDFHGYRTYLILILALFGFLLVDFVRFDPSNDDDMAGFFASYYNFVL